MTSDHWTQCPVCGGSGSIEVPIGARVESLRKRLEMTQDAFAASIGMSRPSLANIEAGRQGVPLKFVVTISRVHHVSSDWLLGTEPSP